MANLDSGSTEDLLHFFILETLSQEPMPSFVVEQRTKRVHRLLERMAEHRGRPRPAPCIAALMRLEISGFVDTTEQDTDSGSEKFYFLSSQGRERLQEQRAGWSSRLAQYVDSGNLDSSFGKFLKGEL